MSAPSFGPVVVTGANGLVGSAICRALAAREVAVVALVRRVGTAPQGPTIQEQVGDFTDLAFARASLAGARALVSTVHPMASDRTTKEQVAVEGTPALARAAAAAGVTLHAHISTAAVYERAPRVGDIDEHGTLVGDTENDYAVTKRDTDLALAGVTGLTRVLLRPPAILGAGASSTWNTLRPQAMLEDTTERQVNPDRSWPWIHVRDLARLAADLVTGAIPVAAGADAGPVEDGCTPVNVVAPPATWRRYAEAVSGALGFDPVWTDEPVWRGRLLNDRARGWGWAPEVTLEEALAELSEGLRRRD